MAEDNPAIDRVLNLFYLLQKQVRSTWPRSWFQFNLTGTALRTLFAIEADETTTPARIADAIDINRTTMTGILDRLESDGLIKRMLDPADRRSFIVELTSLGHNLVQQMDALKREHLNNALLVMQPADLDALVIGLDALVSAVQTTLGADQSPESAESDVLN